MKKQSLPMDEDLYAILGVPPGAGLKEIRSAHRTLAKKYHPDKGEGSSDERFRQIQRAYYVLGDEDRRAAYDRVRSASRRRTERVPAPQPSVFASRHVRTAHLDLRGLGRRPPAESIDLGRGYDSAAHGIDDWDELIAFLFRDLL